MMRPASSVMMLSHLRDLRIASQNRCHLAEQVGTNADDDGQHHDLDAAGDDIAQHPFGKKARLVPKRKGHKDEAGECGQTAWDAGRTSPAPAATQSGGATSSDPAPAWARNLRAQQSARHHRQIAMQTIREGDRGGGAANPDLSEKE